ncbi:MAG TPA: CdaR family protein, partial [Chloroflexota bacterium]
MRVPVFLKKLDVGRLVVAVLLSMALWTVVQNDQNPERVGTFDTPIPIELVNTPPGLVVMNESSLPSVQVALSAPGDTWWRLRRESFRATVNLSGVGAGSHQLPVVVSSTNPQVEVLSVTPSRVTVQLEELVTRDVPVSVRTRGDVPLGYRAGEPQVQPRVVTISGPSSRIEQVQEAVVEVDVTGVTVDVNARYTPIAVNAEGRPVEGVQASPPSVAVLLPVSQQVTYKTVGIHAVSTGVPETGYIIESVATEPATITLVGMPSTLAGINFVETEPVDVSGASNSVVRQVHLRVPNGVTVLGEQTITVTVRISPLSIVQRIRLVPSVRGLAPELRLKEPLPTVEIEVAGPAPVL